MYDTMGAREGGYKGETKSPADSQAEQAARKCPSERANRPDLRFNAVSGQIHNKPRKIHFRGFYAFVGYILIFSDKL